MIEIDRDKGFAVVVITGTPTLGNMMEAVDELLNHPGHLDGMDEIWDFRNASATGFDREDIRSFTEFVKSHLDQLARRTALVVGRDVDYGIGRMWMAYAEADAPQERRIFKDIEDAYEWLGS